MGIPVIEIEDVSKRFTIRREKALKDTLVFRKRGIETVTVLQAVDQVSLTLEAGSTVGLMGHNGSGKSTLLKLIGGILEPDSGKISRRGRLAALLELGAGFHPDLTGRENVFLNAALLGIDKKTTRKKFDEIVDFSGVADFIDTPVKFFSSGMYVRLAFSVAVNVDPDILLVDEVLAVGDEPFQQKCRDKIEGFQKDGRTIVLVSHSATDIQRLATRAVVLDHGKVAFDGDPTAGIQELRAGYRRALKQPTGSFESTSRDIAISGVRAEVGNNKSSPDLTISVDYMILGAVGDYRVNVGVDSLDGFRLFTAESSRIFSSLPQSEGAHALRFSYPHVPLASGAYQISVAIYRDDNSVADLVSGGCEFKISKNTGGHGLLAMVPQAHVS